MCGRVNLGDAARTLWHCSCSHDPGHQHAPRCADPPPGDRHRLRRVRSEHPTAQRRAPGRLARGPWQHRGGRRGDRGRRPHGGLVCSQSHECFAPRQQRALRLEHRADVGRDRASPVGGLGSGPVLHRRRAGDRRADRGRWRTVSLGPASVVHRSPADLVRRWCGLRQLALHPRADDPARARACDPDPCRGARSPCRSRRAVSGVRRSSSAPDPRASGSRLPRFAEWFGPPASAAIRAVLPMCGCFWHPASRTRALIWVDNPPTAARHGNFAERNPGETRPRRKTDLTDRTAR
jgi:hypothetical protein